MSPRIIDWKVLCESMVTAMDWVDFSSAGFIHGIYLPNKF